MYTDVINRSNRIMTNIELVWEIYNWDGELISSVTSPAMIQNLMPAQVSPVYFETTVEGGRWAVAYTDWHRYPLASYYPTDVNNQADWRLVAQSHHFDGQTFVVDASAQNVSAGPRDLKAVLSLHRDPAPRDTVYRATMDTVAHNVASGATVSFQMREHFGEASDYDHHVLTLMSVLGSTGYPTRTPAPTPQPGIPLSSVLQPFDENLAYQGGPYSSTWGKRPEIIVAADGLELDVLAQDYGGETPWNAVLLRLVPESGGYRITQALTDLPMLDRVMGLDNDAEGNRYYATGVYEADRVNATYPPLDTYRSDIVRVVKVDPQGNVLFNIDLDLARHDHNASCEPIINPMTSSTGRLAVGGNEIALVHGNNTDPDWDIGGRRHQKALSTRLNATTGAIERTSSVWVSHSFNQRLFYDGESIIEHHLGDAYPRTIVFGRDHRKYPLFHIKGEHGYNNTYSGLGNLALIEQDDTYGYLALFVTESNANTGSSINGPRNLGMVRVNKHDNTIDPNLPDTLTVDSKGTMQTNRLRWLTHYTDASGQHADRPKLVPIGGDRYIVLWEEWYVHDNDSTFICVRAMLIDAQGNVLRGPAPITSAHYLSQRDDAFRLGDQAGWMTGNQSQRYLYLHLVDENLHYRLITIQ